MEEQLRMRSGNGEGFFSPAREEEEARLKRPMWDDVNLLNFLLGLATLGVGSLLSLLL